MVVRRWTVGVRSLLMRMSDSRESIGEIEMRLVVIAGVCSEHESPATWVAPLAARTYRGNSIKRH